MQRYTNQVRVNSGSSDLGAPVAIPTISVFDAGTSNLSTIFSDNQVSPTPLANPFTGTADGFFFFYAAGGLRYDVQASLGTPAIATPYILEADILLEQLDRIWIPAADFAQVAGSLVIASQGTNFRYAAWPLDAAGTSGVAATRLVSLSYDIGVLTVRIYWTNIGAGAGNVVFRVRALGLGSAVLDMNTVAGEASATDTFTAGAEDALVISLSTLVFTPSLTEFLMRLTVERLGADGSDTLGNDAGLIGLELRYP